MVRSLLPDAAGRPLASGQTVRVDFLGFLDELWRRALSVQPAEPTSTVALIGAVALAAVILAWPLVRGLVTVCHEAGHAVVALLVGRSLKGIKLHSDTSGLTLSRGKPSGPGMIATLFAGYPAAAVVGLGAAWLAGSGYAAGLLWALVVLLALMLLKIRNIYGAWVVVATGAVIGVTTWFAPPYVISWLALGLAWLFLLAAPRPVLEVARNRAPGTDAAQLARISWLPRLGWVALWLLLTVAALVVGAGWLLRLW